MKTLCVDFDGVINLYTSGWTWLSHIGDIPDRPVEGAFDWLEEMVKHFKVYIYSSRSKFEGGIYFMKKWFIKHGFSSEVLNKLEFPTQKPPAHLIIDDRAYLFKGPSSFPSVEFIQNFKPWNK